MTTIICSSYGKYLWAKNYPSKQAAIAFLSENQELTSQESETLAQTNQIRSGLSVFTLEEV